MSRYGPAGGGGPIWINPDIPGLPKERQEPLKVVHDWATITPHETMKSTIRRTDTVQRSAKASCIEFDGQVTLDGALHADMGSTSSRSMVKRCLGTEVAPAVVKSLAGATQQIVEGVIAKITALGTVPGLSRMEVAQVLGEARGYHTEELMSILGPKTPGRIDVYEMLALMIMCSKTPVRFKARKLFDMLDLDRDGNLNFAETILMLRSLLSAIAKSTGGDLPMTAGVEAIWSCIVRFDPAHSDERLSYAQWVIFCSKTREVHDLGRALDFNRGHCRKALWSGSGAPLSGVVIGHEDPEEAAERAAAAKKLREQTPLLREQKRAVAAKERKNRFSHSTVLKIKEVFDGLDKEGSGYVDERRWRELTKDTPLAATDNEDFLLMQREREGKISIVEVLSEVYPFAGDADLTKMLRWVSEEPSLQGAERLVDQELAAAEQDEMASLFRVYNPKGNDEMTLGEVSKAMADISGLTKEDVMPMFMCPTKTEEDLITASEFAEMLKGFIDSDPSIQSLMRPAPRE